jgi:transposase
MMGRRQQIEPKLFYTGVNLEERIPADHRLRRIAAVVDFSFVRQQVAETYGHNGHESLDPTVLMKLMLLLFLENVPSERQVIEQLGYRMDWLWFCGLDLDATVPDSSVLSKARRRWGPEVFAGLFGEVLQRCVAAGLVDGRVVHVDASCVAAAVDERRLVPVLRQVGEGLYEQLETAAEAESPAGHWTSATDPEAGVTRNGGQMVCGYKEHRAVDDAQGIITATVTTDAATNEGQMLVEVLKAHEANTGAKPETVVADTQYGSAANYRQLHEQEVRACIPHVQGGTQPGKFGHEAFRYDAAEDCFWCPAGERLRPYQRQVARRRVIYRAARGVCQQCPLRSQCTDSRHGRGVERHLDQEHVDWAEQCLSPGCRRRLMHRRQVVIEGSFADAANCHGFKQARWRGRWAVRIQNLLVATCQNLRKWLRAARRGGRALALSHAAAGPAGVALGRQRSVARRRSAWTRPCVSPSRSSSFAYPDLAVT